MSGFALKHEILGVGKGNFNMKTVGIRKVLETIEIYKDKLGIDKVFSPRCGFTNKIVEIDKNGEVLLSDSKWFIRSKDEADGGIVKVAYDAVVIFNADCPVVAVYHDPSDRLAVLHAGFRCLVPEARRGKRDRSIIQVLFDDFKFPAKECIAFVGCGIGPCCFGVTDDRDHYPEVNDLPLNIPCGRPSRGDRANWRQSIDLYTLATRQLLQAGILEKNISVDFTCTSCAGFHKPIYYSSCRMGTTYGRNATLVWTEYIP